MATLVGATAYAVPPTISSISPNSVVQKTVPQATLVVTGTDFTTGTSVTLRLPNPRGGSPLATYTKVGTVDGTGTTITLTPGTNTFNLLQAPLGAYDVIVTRPDTETATLPGAFSIATYDSSGLGIDFELTGRWGGPVDDIDVVGDFAYIANGRMLRILNIANPANPVEVGNIDLHAVGGVRVRNGYAFVGASSPYQLCVVDVSNPAQPKLVWKDYTSNKPSPKSIFFRDNLLYVHDEVTRTISVYDVTDPLNVTYVGVNNLGVPPSILSRPDKVQIIGDRLYTGSPNFESPSHPNADPSSGGVPCSFRVYEFSANPLVPTLLGAYYAPFPSANPSAGVDDTFSISVEGNLACWAVLEHHTLINKVYVLDISNPAAPAKVGSWPSHNNLHVAGVDMLGGRAYVGDLTDDTNWPQSQGLVILDVAANPVNPPVVGTHKTHGCLRGLRTIGNRTYLFDSGEGLIIVDTTNPANPVRLGYYHSPANLREMVKPSGSDLLYIADRWHGFTVLNVADPAHPVVVGSYAADHYQGLGLDAFGIAYQNNRIYLGAGHLGVEVVDVTNPASPSFLGAFRIPEAACDHDEYWGISITGNIVHAGYVKKPVIANVCANGTPVSYVHNLDITNPSNIVKVGEVALTPNGNLQAPRKIVLNSQKFGFIGHDAPGGEIITNLQSPTNPTVVYYYVDHPPDSTWMFNIVDVALDGDVAFLAAKGDFQGWAPWGLYVRDVSNPAQPTTLAVLNNTFPMPNGWGLLHPFTAAVQNHRLYSNMGTNMGVTALHMFDVANPSAPVFLARSPTYDAGSTSPEASSRLLVEEPRAYCTTALADDSFGASITLSEGLAIYDIHNLPQLCPADINEDHTVNIDDLVQVITNWGPCLEPPPAPLKLGGPGSGPGSGDMNCDFATNTFDINPFMLALNDWEQYVKDYQDCDLFNGDMNNSGFPIDQADLAIFCPLAGGVVSGGQCLVPVACPADTNGDHVINIDDLVQVITNWGSCD